MHTLQKPKHKLCQDTKVQQRNLKKKVVKTSMVYVCVGERGDDSPVLVFEGNRLSCLDVGSIVITGTFVNGDTNVVFIQIETVSTGTSIHRQKVRGAALLV